MTRFARTPSSRAVCESMEAARICRPIVVRSSSSVSAVRHTIATTIATIVILRMSTPEIVTGWLRSPNELAIFPSGPNQTSAMLWSRNATAKVATSMTAGVRPRSGRKTR